MVLLVNENESFISHNLPSKISCHLNIPEICINFLSANVVKQAYHRTIRKYVTMPLMEKINQQIYTIKAVSKFYHWLLSVTHKVK